MYEVSDILNYLFLPTKTEKTVWLAMLWWSQNVICRRIIIFLVIRNISHLLEKCKSKLQWGITSHQLESLLFSHLVMSNSLWPCGLQYARPPFPSPSPGDCSNSCALSRWFHQIISSSVMPFLSCLQYFPSSESFPVSQLFTSGAQSIGASALAPVLSMNTQELTSFCFDRFYLQGTLKSLLQHHSSNSSVHQLNLLCGPNLIFIYYYWKKHSFDYMDLWWQCHCFSICFLGWS